MTYRRIAACATTAAVLGISIAAQERGSDAARALADMRREAFEHSQVMTAFDQFVTVIGPRLTGSPAHKAAADWANTTLTAWGLTASRLEPWEFGRGWV